MSCKFNGVLPAADMRRFTVGQLALTPLWIAGTNRNGESGWQAEVVVGTVIIVQDEYDAAPDAEVAYWQKLIIEVTFPGNTERRRFTRTSYDATPLIQVG